MFVCFDKLILNVSYLNLKPICYLRFPVSDNTML